MVGSVWKAHGRICRRRYGPSAFEFRARSAEKSAVLQSRASSTLKYRSIGKSATVAEGIVDTMGLTLKKYSMHHPVMHIRELSKDVIAKLKKDLKELKAAAKAASEPENKDRKKRQLAQLEEERAALEAKIQKLEDPEATDDEPLEQPPAAHEDEPAILEQGKPGDTKACPACTYVCSQAFMCCPMCRHDFFFMDEECAF